MGLDLSQVYVVVLLFGMTDKMIPIFMRGHLGLYLSKTKNTSFLCDIYWCGNNEGLNCAQK